MLIAIIGIFFFWLGDFASADFPDQNRIDTRSKLLVDYSPWSITLFQPINFRIFEAISTETGRNVDPDKITDIDNASLFWEAAIPEGQVFILPSATSIPPSTTPTILPNTLTPSSTATLFITKTQSATLTNTNTPPPAASSTPTLAPTKTNTLAPSQTPPHTPTPSATASFTPTFTATFTPTNTPTPSDTPTPTFTPSPTSSCIAGSITRDAFQDTYTDVSAPTAIRGANNDLKIKNPGQDRTLIEVDTSDISSTCIVSAASIYLTVTNEDADMGLQIHRITAAWDEATTSWDTEPAFDSTSWASFTAPSITLINIDITNLVQAWVDGTYANHGLLIQSVSNLGEVKFDSLNIGNGPYFDIAYGP